MRDGRRLLCFLPFHSGGAQASSQRPRLPRYARGRTVAQAKPLSYCRAVIVSSFILSFCQSESLKVLSAVARFGAHDQCQTLYYCTVVNQYINHIEEKTEECPKQSLLGLQKSVCATNYAVVYG